MPFNVSKNRNYSVYIHTFPNGKVYVGITCESPERRWRADGSGYRKQRVMRFAIAKYGWQNVKHEIVASSLSKDDACNLEIELIAKYKSNQHEYGYNVDNGGQTSGSHSEETLKKMSESMKRKWKQSDYSRILTDKSREKMSLAHKGKKLGEENAAARTVICIETQEIFSTIKEAAEFANVDRAAISGCVRGKYKTAGGYHWKYYNLNSR